MLNGSLRNQIVALAVSLVLITTIVIQLTSWWSASNFNQRQIEDRITSASNVLVEYLSLRDELLTTASSVLAADFGFKQAVATGDEDTIISVLSNHSQRIDADMMILTDTQGQLVADSQNQFNDMSLDSFLGDFDDVSRESQIAALDGRVYQFLLQPVKAPRTVGYVVVGFEVNLQGLKRLKELTGMEISVARDGQALLSTITDKDSFSAISPTELQMATVYKRPNFLTAKISDDQLNSPGIDVFLSADLRPIYREYDALAYKILLIASISVLIAIITAFVVSRSMSRPLRQLGEMADDFARGHYQSKDHIISGSVEIQQLSTALVSMGQAIQSREHKIILQSEYDSLTGLMNQSKLKSRLSQKFLSWERSMQVVIQIDNFREINDKLGPDFADRCLEEIARRLLKIMHPAESFHARFDGVEFFSVFNLTADTPAPSEIRQTLVQQISLPMELNSLHTELVIYCGITYFPQDGTTEDTIIRRTRLSADHARLQRQQIHVYEKGQDEQRLAEFATIEALNNALSSERGELYLHFQPKLDLQASRVTAVETLIRWQRPDAGEVRPDIFVALAEQAGLITRLTRWVVEQTFEQQSRWHVAGIPLHVAINVSAEDICQENFSQFMLAAADRHQLSPQYCTVELTERDIMQNEQRGLIVLRQLRAAGFRIALDDYGVGQSALAKLKELPVDEIKLDKTFILKLEASHADQHIVFSTIQLAHSLGLKVVAEGVENAETLGLLRDYGCNTAQGYFISRPVSSAQLETWLNNETDYHRPVTATDH